MIAVRVVLAVIGWGAFIWWARRTDLRRMRRCEQEGDDWRADWFRRRAQAAGALVILAAVALPVPLALGGLGVPTPIPALVAIPMGLLGVKVVNGLGCRRPELVLPHIRWPDELRTLRTPAGRVLLGIGLIVVVVVPLAAIRAA